MIKMIEASEYDVMGLRLVNCLGILEGTKHSKHEEMKLPIAYFENKGNEDFENKGNEDFENKGNEDYENNFNKLFFLLTSDLAFQYGFLPVLNFQIGEFQIKLWCNLLDLSPVCPGSDSLSGAGATGDT